MITTKYEYLKSKSKSEVIDIIATRVFQLRERKKMKKIAYRKVRATVHRLVSDKGVDKTIDLFQPKKMQARFQFDKQLMIL